MRPFTTLQLQASLPNADTDGMHPARRGMAVVFAALVAVLVALIPLASNADGQTPPAKQSPSAPSGIASVVHPGTLLGMHLMNYYPSDGGWSDMWTNFQPAKLDADFSKMSGLGANAVRIIVFPSAFGYPTVAPLMLARLATVLNIAAKNDLRVQLTLFDWWGDYADVAGSQRWMKSLLGPLKGDTRIELVELKNEVDPGDQPQMSWICRLMPTLQQLLPGVPRTVSIADTGLGPFTELVRALRTCQPDVWDYHYYGPADLAYSELQRIQAEAKPLPLIIGEAGYSTAARVDAPGALEEAQAYFYSCVFAATQALRLPPPAPWTLTDFEPGSIPSAAVSGRPTAATAADPREYAFGLFRLDGKPKPAAAVVMNAFHGRLTYDIDGAFQHEALAPSSTTAGIWLLFHANEGNFAIDHQVSRAGSASARISNSGGDATGVPSFYVSPVATVHANQLWAATVWARGQKVTGKITISFSWFNVLGKYLGNVESTTLPLGDTTWTPLHLAARAPQGATQLQLHLMSSHDTGTAWFDDVSVSDATPSP